MNGRDVASSSDHACVPWSEAPKLMHPRQMRDTSRPVLPSLVYFIASTYACQRLRHDFGGPGHRNRGANGAGRDRRATIAGRRSSRPGLLPDLAVCVGSCSCRWPLSACWRPGARTRTPRRTTRSALRQSTPNLDLLPHDQVTSCVESTKFGAFVGDAAALDRWNSAGQSDDDLAEVCTQIWRADPTALDKIHSDWMATQAMIAAEP